MDLTPAALRAIFAGEAENFKAAATPGGIEAQEAAGQRALCASSRLPREMNPNREAYEALGFVIVKPSDDDLFFDVTLPEGWKYESTDHSMWSKIVDETGAERVSVFYKAAFYDQRASCSLVSSEDDGA